MYEQHMFYISRIPTTIYSLHMLNKHYSLLSFFLQMKMYLNLKYINKSSRKEHAIINKTENHPYIMDS